MVEMEERDPRIKDCWKDCPFPTYRVFRIKIYDEIREELKKILLKADSNKEDLGKMILEFMENSILNVIERDRTYMKKRQELYQKIKNQE